MNSPCVVSVSRDEQHRFSKPVVDSIELLAGLGLGVEGDAHCATTTQHLFLVRG